MSERRAVLKAVIDTNIWISALLGTRASKKLKDHLSQEHYQAICSTDLIDELLDVLARSKFAGKITDIDAADLLRVLRKAATFVQPEQIDPTSRDPKDDVFLACAVAAAADYLVTGDKDLLTLAEFRGTKIVTPKQFLEILEAQA
jgi:putative PIN family toxin of toxin-antitoxin system